MGSEMHNLHLSIRNENERRIEINYDCIKME